MKIYTVFATDKCNLSCKYCEHIKTKDNLNENTFLKIFDNIRNNSVNSDFDIIKISIIGGEPFLNFNLLKFAVSTIKRVDKRFKLSVATNLSILTEEMYNFILENKEFVEICISTDGIKKVHDFNRNNSYDTVFENYKKLQKCGVSLSSCSVIDVNFISYMFINFLHLYNIGFRQLTFLFNLNDMALFYNQDNSKKVCSEIDKICSFIREVSDPFLNVRLERLSLTNNENTIAVNCQSDNNIYIDCNGQEFSCTRAKYANVENHPKTDEKCLKCKALKFCCNCFGVDSFVYKEGVKSLFNFNKNDIKLYQDNYCNFLINYIITVNRHWEVMDSNKPETALFSINNNTYFLIKNPKFIDIGDKEIFVAFDKKISILVKSHTKINGMLIISKDNLHELYDILYHSINTLNITSFYFRYIDIHKFNELDFKYLKQTYYKICTEFKNISIDLGKHNNEYFMHNSIKYSDINFKFPFKEVEKTSLCENCCLDCNLNALYNKEVTGEERVPPYAQCVNALLFNEVGKPITK